MIFERKNYLSLLKINIRMRKTLLFIFIQFIAIQLVSAQTTSEPENLFKDMTLEEAKDRLESELWNLQMFISLGDAFSDNHESEEDEDIIDKDIEGIEPYKINEASTIKDSLTSLFSRLTFGQVLKEPQSKVKLNLSDYQMAKLIDNKAKYDLYEPVFTTKHIYYADGEVSNESEDFDLQIANKKIIDSISVSVYYTYPLSVSKITLSESNPLFILDGDSIHLTAIKGRNGKLMMTDGLRYKVCAVYANTVEENKLISPISTLWRTGSSDAMNAYFKDAEVVLKKLLVNIEKGKYKDVDELNKDYWKQAPKEPEEQPEDKINYASFDFNYKIQSLDIYYVDEFEEYESQYTLKNAELSKYKSSNYYVASNDKALYGIVDKSGNWIVEPFLYTLEFDGGDFFEGKTSEQDEEWTTYKLNVSNNKLDKCDFSIDQIWEDGLLLINDADSFSRRGVINNKGKYIIPLEEQTIYYSSDLKMLTVAKMNKDNYHYTLLDSDGNPLLKNKYKDINIEDSYVYVRTFDKPENQIVYDRDLKQVSKKNWMEVSKFQPALGLFFVKDLKGNIFCADRYGNPAIVPNKYSFIEYHYFAEGYCAVKKEIKDGQYQYGFVDFLGNVAIPLEYEYVDDFMGGYARATKGGEDILIDKSNKVHLKFPSPIASSFIFQNDPKETRYTLENGFVYDGMGNFIEDAFRLENGDLIFQESCEGNMGNAIKDVTSGIDGYNFTHVGMVWIDEVSDSIYVIEATHPKVRITPLDEYLKPKDKDCAPRSVVGRLNSYYQSLIPQAIEEAKKLVGKDYDDAFDLQNDKYYCSELVYDAFMKANCAQTIRISDGAELESTVKEEMGKMFSDKEEAAKFVEENYQTYLQAFAVFQLNKMTFKSKDTGEFTPYWVEHFENLAIPIPECEWGINPNDMSKQSDVINIIRSY